MGYLVFEEPLPRKAWAKFPLVQPRSQAMLLQAQSYLTDGRLVIAVVAEKDIEFPERSFGLRGSGRDTNCRGGRTKAHFPGPFQNVQGSC
jgi:hypothetical protein